jgi:hypothetical protein
LLAQLINYCRPYVNKGHPESFSHQPLTRSLPNQPRTNYKNALRHLLPLVLNRFAYGTDGLWSLTYLWTFVNILTKKWTNGNILASKGVKISNQGGG